MQASLPIQVASERSGLSPHVIRAWERRYQAIAPERSAGRHRQYSDDEIERLSLLGRVVRNGHSIGRIARLTDGELRDLLVGDDSQAAPAEAVDSAAELRAEALGAIEDFNEQELDGTLRKSALLLGHQGLLCHIVAELAREVGEKWRAGDLTVAHEHFFTAAVKSCLGELGRQFVALSEAPRIVTCTPAGQHHDLGAVIASTYATSLGWRSILLGASLPAHEIAGAVHRNGAVAVALSIVFPDDDPSLPAELMALAKLLPAATGILIGGRTAWNYQDAIDAIGAVRVDSLDDYGNRLDQLRRRSSVKPNEICQ